MRYCKECGAAISQDNVFCTHCGTKLDITTKKEPTFEDAMAAMRQVIAYTAKKVEDAIEIVNEKIESDPSLKEAREKMRQAMTSATEKFEDAIETIEDTIQKALEDPGKKKCDRCGTTLPKTAMYCWRCGEAVKR
ncbi:MAG: zinc-ribbon domain-containing protein [Candidatus Heimdallarchaeota archaeon]